MDLALAVEAVAGPVTPAATGPAGTAPAATTEAPANAFGLSPRELEVLRLLIEGKSNAEVGETLFISPRTAGTHVANILAKLGVNSRAAAVAAAMSRGLV